MLELRVQHRVAPGFALDVNICAHVPRLGVFGPSGAGKSALLNAVAGMSRPDHAVIRCNGTTWVDTAAGVYTPLHARRIGYMTQEPLLFPHRSVEANLRYSPAGSTATRRFHDIVDVLHLGPLLDRAPRHLSGGEQNRVALGRALLSDPALLLLDEPFAGLDADSRRDAMALLHRVHTVFAVPWLLVSHHSADLVTLADEVVALDAGRVLAQGAPLACMAAHSANPQALAHAVDNLLWGPVTPVGDDSALAELTWGGHTLLVPAPAGDGTHATYGCFANSIVLSLDEPVRQSARNHVRARVATLHPIGAECVVELAVGSASLRALVLQQTVTALGLAVGSPVVANLKSTSLAPLG